MGRLVDGRGVPQVPDTQPGRVLADLMGPADGVPFGDWEGTVVTGLAIDSRRVRPGDVFFALPGGRREGARFVAEAVARGTVAVVLPLDAAPVEGVPGIRAADPRRLLAAAAARFYGEPAASLRIIGVTGTNGKTTTVWMTGAVLAAAGAGVGLLTTAEVFTGRERFRPEYTTPEPHDLHRYFRDMVASGFRYACMEVSSHGIVLQRVRGVPFQVGIVTNVTPDHQDFHPSFEHYVAAKRAFVAGLGEEAVCLLNADDERVRAMAGASRARVLTYGFSPAALQAVGAYQAAGGTGFTLRVREPLPLLDGAGSIPPGEFPAWIPLLGRHNVLNALAAAGAALVSGVDPRLVLEALAGFRPPARRLETIRVGPFTVINDVAMNEGSYEAVMETLASLAFPQVVVVNAIRGNRGPAVNAGIARVLARWDRRLSFAPLIATASESHVARYRADYLVRPAEAAAFRAAAEAEGLAVSFHRELDAAVEEGVGRLRPGGALILLGTFGMDDGADIAAGLLRRRLEVADG